MDPHPARGGRLVRRRHGARGRPHRRGAASPRGHGRAGGAVAPVRPRGVRLGDHDPGGRALRPDPAHPVPGHRQAPRLHRGGGPRGGTVGAAGARTPVSRFLSSRVLTYVGAISYGIFLWHLPIMFQVRSLLGLDVFAYGFWATVVLTLGGVDLCRRPRRRHFLEAPIQAWARRRTTRTAGTPPTSGTAQVAGPGRGAAPRGTAPTPLTRCRGSSHQQRARGAAAPTRPRRPQPHPPAPARPSADGAAPR